MLEGFELRVLWRRAPPPTPIINFGISIAPGWAAAYHEDVTAGRDLGG